MAVKGELLKTLEELGDEEFTKFKWFLEKSSEISKSHLENADRLKTVDKIVQIYNQQSLEVVEKTLKEMKRNDLVEKLSNTSPGEHVEPMTRGNSMDRPINSTNTPVSSSPCGASLSYRNMAQCNVSPRYKDIISECTLISKPLTSPAVYKLRPKEEKFGTLTRKTVGEKNLNKINKNILLVGETGTGKSTLINALVNYTMGVKFKDNIWFEIVEDEERSQTSYVITYEIFGYEDETLPYSLTIIDTPGYGSTKGIEHDVIISQRLFDLFRSDEGVHELSAVGLVLKASENRVSDRLSYIFDSVTSLFGKDIEKNIVALITHSNGLKPDDALKALKAANIKCAKDEENKPVHFLFDNCQNTERTKKNKLALKNAWRTTEAGMKQFKHFLEKTQPQKLNKTVEVLNTRIRLTACIQNLQERIQLIDLKQRVIQQTEEALEKYEEEMKKNEKEKYEENKSESERSEEKSLMEHLRTEMKKLKAEKIKLLDEVYQHVVKLEQIAMNDNSLSIHVHLDFLIEKMKETGDKEKVEKLEEMKSLRDEETRAAWNYMYGKMASAGKAIKSAVKRGHHQIAE